MKKLLLLLFISFAFIGSANANSIEGAFGYLLGETQSPEKKDCWYNFDCYSYSGFEPKKPLSHYPHYMFNLTFTTNKIYEIKGWTRREREQLENCDGYDSEFGKILGMLEAKYGDFEKISWGYKSAAFKFEDGDRRIFINCFSDRERDSYESTLTYTDFKLEKLHKNEIEAYKKTKFLEEAKDYDL